MDFKNLTVKECFADPRTKAVVEKYAPQLMKYPLALFNKKKCGEIFDLVVSKKILPVDVAKQIESAINEVLKN